jgi:small subunit ribosomal protein S4
MGDPKFSRKMYSRPSHPWDGPRILEEKGIIKKYGMKNKRELWKVKDFLRRYRRIARNLQARLLNKEGQAAKEKEQLLKSLIKKGLLGDKSDLNDVLALGLEAVLGRRLQTLVHLKGLAYTPGQARQLIIHGHISLNGKKITIPGYLVMRGEDEQITYRATSPFTSEMHPMRPKPAMARELEIATAQIAPKPAEGPAPPAQPAKPAKEEEKAPADLNVTPGGGK